MSCKSLPAMYEQGAERWPNAAHHASTASTKRTYSAETRNATMAPPGHIREDHRLPRHHGAATTTSLRTAAPVIRCLKQAHGHHLTLPNLPPPPKARAAPHTPRPKSTTTPLHRRPHGRVTSGRAGAPLPIQRHQTGAPPLSSTPTPAAMPAPPNHRARAASRPFHLELILPLRATSQAKALQACPLLRRTARSDPLGTQAEPARQPRRRPPCRSAGFRSPAQAAARGGEGGEGWQRRLGLGCLPCRPQEESDAGAGRERSCLLALLFRYDRNIGSSYDLEIYSCSATTRKVYYCLSSTSISYFLLLHTANLHHQGQYIITPSYLTLDSTFFTKVSLSWSTYIVKFYKAR